MRRSIARIARPWSAPLKFYEVPLSPA